MAQKANADTATKCVNVEQLDDLTGAPDADSAVAEIGVGEVTVRLVWNQPIGDVSVTADVEERPVNQYASFECYYNGETTSTYERHTATRIRLLYRVGDDWHYGEPKVPLSTWDKAGYPQSNLDPDGHLPTQVDGVTRRRVASRSNPRDSFKKARFKVTRSFLERVDEAYVLEWDEKHEAGRNGSYTSKSNETAYKLVLEE